MRSYSYSLTIRLILLSIAVLPLVLCAQKKKKQGSARNVPDSLTNYRLFEKRDVGAYRARMEFIDPYLTITPRTPAVPEADTVLRRVPVQVDMAPSMARLLDRHIEENAARTETEGYRIQIFSGASRDMAYKIREDAASMHSTHTAYAFYDRPYFKVRVGDLVSRDEADRLCRELRGTYPGAFVVPDVVKVRK